MRDDEIDVEEYERQLNEYCGQVIAELVSRGVNAEGWHAGGGIFGVLITTTTECTLFSTLAVDGPAVYQWNGWDLNDPDGEVVANLTSFSRPFGSSDEAGGPATPEEVADDVVTVLRAIDPNFVPQGGVQDE